MTASHLNAQMRARCYTVPTLQAGQLHLATIQMSAEMASTIAVFTCAGLNSTEAQIEDV